MASGSLFFTKSAILPIFDPILQRERKKDLHFRYTTHITRTSQVWQAIWGADIFSTSYSQKMASGSLFLSWLSEIKSEVGSKIGKIALFVKNNDPEAIFRL